MSSAMSGSEECRNHLAGKVEFHVRFPAELSKKKPCGAGLKKWEFHVRCHVRLGKSSAGKVEFHVRFPAAPHKKSSAMS